jgi:predicted nucleic acid-binding protein
VIVVSNSTPLITLSKVGYFDLLQKLFTEITVSQEVWNEVVVRGAGLAGSSETSQAGWIKVRSVANSALVKEWRNAYNLGAGELSTILLAKELTASVAVIDERRARRLAVTEGLAVSGSIAVLESGYRKKYVSDLRAAYRQLLTANIWIDQKKLNQSLASFGLSPL